MRDRKKRLNKVGRRIEATPITSAAEDAAFERFRETGDLPDHKRLAAHTIERAIQLPRHRPLRETLLQEAIHEFSVVRLAARGVLKLLVSLGQDVTSRNLLDEDMEPPEYGSVAMHLLGWPECIVRPPYEEQARRLLGRLASVRRQVTPGDERWFRRFAATAARFFTRGELTEDEFVRGAVLVYGEFLALCRNIGGQGDPAVLAAFDEAARVAGEMRDAAVERLQELAAEGRIP